MQLTINYHPRGQGALYLGPGEGGALPVIMFIAGPRETHDDRDYNLWVT